ncbi:MAG TPA: hypothetical protein VED24_02260 [Candidatus Acidoferrum sp.]|nr:hypothetical protein [Candidatus Acidoferrum sp.]
MTEERIIKMPAEWGGVVPTEAFLEQGRKIVEEATTAKIPLRLIGGVAIRVHSDEYADFARRLGRLGPKEQEYTDLDFMSYAKFRDNVRKFFESVGYRKRRATLSSAATQRQIYFHPDGWFYADVFFDKLLAANHPIDFRGRLEMDSPTISLVDLLLEKLQIVSFSEKDLKDTLLLLRAHSLGEGHAPETIDMRYVASLLSKDWGFWYTVTTNLKGLQKVASEMTELNDAERNDVTSKISKLLEVIENEPKTTGWKMRSKIGSRKRWYEPVETSQTVGEFGIWRL